MNDQNKKQKINISGKVLVAALLLAPIVTLLLLAMTTVPLGITGEWVWRRIEWSLEVFASETFNWSTVVIVGLLYLWDAIRRLNQLQKQLQQQAVVKPIGSLIGLVVIGFLWVWMVQEVPPAGQGQRLSKVPFVLYSPAASGYFFTARYKTEEGTSTFLSTYEARMARGDVLHEGTHPPGLYLLHQACITACHASPTLTNFMLNPLVITLEEEQAFGALQKEGNIGPMPLSREDIAAIRLAGMLTQLLVVASVIPLFYLLWRHCDVTTSWKVVVFFPLIPALAIFLPKSDALYPFIGMTFLCCWMYACDRRSWLLAMVAGVVFWIGMFFSLAILPVGLLAVLLTVWEYWFTAIDDKGKDQSTNMKQPQLKKTLLLVLVAACGFLGMTLLTWLLWDLNLLNVWWWNYKNHAAFYSQFTRTYWKWLLVNPLELMFAIGLPMTLAVAVGIVKQLRGNTPVMHIKNGVLFCALAVWGLLWLSGKNSGEAARLWLVIEIWFVWLLCYSPLLQTNKIELTDDVSLTSTIVANRQWCLLLLCQLFACLITVATITGFTFK